MPASLQDVLRAHGLRATPGRERVLGILRGEARPLTHAEVVALASSGSDQATVFRVLLDLVEVGLACRIELGDRLYRFEATNAESGRPDHPHFVCTRCADVACLPGVELVAKRGKLRRIARQKVEIQLRGVCDDCA